MKTQSYILMIKMYWGSEVPPSFLRFTALVYNVDCVSDNMWEQSVHKKSSNLPKKCQLVVTANCLFSVRFPLTSNLSFHTGTLLPLAEFLIFALQCMLGSAPSPGKEACQGRVCVCVCVCACVRARVCALVCICLGFTRGSMLAF